MAREPASDVDPGTPRASLAARVVDAGIRVGIALGVLWLLPPLFGRLHWIIDLANFATLQAALGLGVVGLLAALRRHRRHALLALVLCLLQAARVAVHVERSGPPPRRAPALTLLVANVHTANRHYDALARIVERHDPHVIGLFETSTAWTHALDRRLSRYTTRLIRPREDNFGIALYARVPVERARVVDMGIVPALAGRVAFGAGDLDFALAHVVPPLGSTYAALRARQLAHLARIARSLEAPALVAGDFNATPYSALLQRTVRDTGMRRVGGIRGTFPTGLPPPLRLPIDHVLCSSGLVARVSVAGDSGSDHLPLLVRLWPGRAASGAHSPPASAGVSWGPGLDHDFMR